MCWHHVYIWSTGHARCRTRVNINRGRSRSPKRCCVSCIITRVCDWSRRRPWTHVTTRRSQGPNMVPVKEADTMKESRTRHSSSRRSWRDGGVEVSARLGGELISRSPATVRSLPIGDGSVESRSRRGGGGSQWRIDLDGPPVEGAMHDAPAQVQRDQEEKWFRVRGPWHSDLIYRRVS
jgi:hypothetical protein